jgi:rhodanese-related sulfurtransferase
VGAAVGIALVTLLIGQPTAERKIAWQAEELGARLASREVFIDPAEVLGLMHNNQIQRILLDVRDDSDFNVFHLRDAKHVTLEELEDDWPATIPAAAVVVVMSNDEQSAVDAWKRLAVHGNVNAYILAGGVNRWLDLYREKLPNVPGPETAAGGNDQLRYRFDQALGDRVPVARPDREVLAKRSYTAKVKVLKPVREEGGGCG